MKQTRLSFFSVVYVFAMVKISGWNRKSSLISRFNLLVILSEFLPSLWCFRQILFGGKWTIFNLWEANKWFCNSIDPKTPRNLELPFWDQCRVIDTVLVERTDLIGWIVNSCFCINLLLFFFVSWYMFA